MAWVELQREVALSTAHRSMADTVGKINPYLYRGNYYDAETGFYYLNSRYYDPQTGRFLNADGQLNPDTGLTGNNLFAYCNNNPVGMVDDGGSRPLYSLDETAEERAASFATMNKSYVNSIKLVLTMMITMTIMKNPKMINCGQVMLKGERKSELMMLSEKIDPNVNPKAKIFMIQKMVNEMMIIKTSMI